MYRRALLSALLLAAAWPARAAAEWWLVTQEEAVRDIISLHPPPVASTPVAGAPTIEQLQPPPLNALLQRPFSMRLNFRPSPGAQIVVSSFKATYGWLKLDITARLLAHASISADGLAADDITAPIGLHLVTVSIADTLGRVGSGRFRFTLA